MPKPLVPVAGRPFLSWVTSSLIGQGVTDLVYSTGHLGDQIETWVGTADLPDGIQARCRREPTPLGTGGAVLACLDACQELVMVVNGDTLLLTELPSVISRLRAEGLDGVIVGVPVADASRFGTLEVDDDGMLRSFREKQPGAGIVNGGIYLFPRAVLERFLPVRVISFEREILPELIRGGARIGVTAREAPFIDIGVPETLARADDFIAAYRDRVDGPAGR